MAMQSPISNVALLINISIEWPEIGAVKFEQIQVIFKEHNKKILLCLCSSVR